MITQCGCVVKQPQNFKDGDYPYNQVDFCNFAFLGSCKEDNVQVLLHENEVSNYFKALTVIE